MRLRCSCCRPAPPPGCAQRVWADPSPQARATHAGTARPLACAPLPPQLAPPQIPLIPHSKLPPTHPRLQPGFRDLEAVTSGQPGHFFCVPIPRPAGAGGSLGALLLQFASGEQATLVYT